MERETGVEFGKAHQEINMWVLTKWMLSTDRVNLIGNQETSIRGTLRMIRGRGMVKCIGGTGATIKDSGAKVFRTGKGSYLFLPTKSTRACSRIMSLWSRIIQKQDR